MQGQVERLLPLLAVGGPWIFATLLVASVVCIAWLGRGGPFLIPRHWPARLASAGLAIVALIACLGLYVVTGPMAPVLAQVRYVLGVVGRPVQEVAFREVSTDTPHQLSDLKGRVVVFNLWATWCGPCRHEMPEITRLQRDFAGRGVVVLTISTEEREKLLAFAAKYPSGTLNAYAPRIDWLDVRGRPMTFVIDRRGIVRECFIGARDYPEFARAVGRCLEGDPVAGGP